MFNLQQEHIATARFLFLKAKKNYNIGIPLIVPPDSQMFDLQQGHIRLSQSSTQYNLLHSTVDKFCSKKFV